MLVIMFDTHCHLNFKVFEGKIEKVIKEAKDSSVSYFVIPGTDVETSKKAIEIAGKFNGVFAAVGIHPHHVFYEIQNLNLKSQNEILNLKIKEIEKLLNHPKTVAVGEIGLDYYLYQKTKYQQYQIDEEFIKFQKIFFIEQLKLAKKYKKTIIIHNRKAKDDLLKILTNNQSLITNNKIVFHCCEPDEELLNFVVKNKIYIGIDGDVAYNKKKQDFIKKIPLEFLVLETDSPFLSPNKHFPNQPKNLPLIAGFIAKLIGVSYEKLKKTTFGNAKKLFKL